jgi:flagellar basal body-associated protein FliL
VLSLGKDGLAKTGNWRLIQAVDDHDLKIIESARDPAKEFRRGMGAGAGIVIAIDVFLVAVAVIVYFVVFKKKMDAKNQPSKKADLEAEKKNNDDISNFGTNPGKSQVELQSK